MKDLLADIKNAIELQKYLESLQHESGKAWGALEWFHIYEQVKQ